MIPKRVEFESQDLNLHFSISFGTHEAEEEEDDLDGEKDAVFVTDGDSDLGQVCVSGFHRAIIHWMQQDETDKC